jgi:hypothetical protein
MRSIFAGIIILSASTAGGRGIAGPARRGASAGVGGIGGDAWLPGA